MNTVIKSLIIVTLFLLAGCPKDDYDEPGRPYEPPLRPVPSRPTRDT